ncbi:MAG: thermonuclease family protein, partial [Thermoleophilia bacterium]|nr:thermonuclease family protein [Thermoleophilia bacterium]
MLLFAVLVLAATRLIDTGAGPGRSGDAGGGSVSPATDLRPRDAHVLRVVDGDTILVRLVAGGTERVRYIGVDTPESVKPNTPVQCFGKRASHYNQQLVQNRDVHL